MSNGSHGSFINTLGDIGDHSVVIAVDQRPAGIGNVVGQECGVSVQNSHVAGSGSGDAVVGDGCGDGGGTLSDAGDSAVFVNRSDVLVGGGPLDLHIQAAGHHDQTDVSGFADLNDLLGGSHHQVVQGGIVCFGELVTDDVHTADLSAGRADGAQVGGSAGLGVDDGQAAQIVAAVLCECGPVHGAGVVVIGHGGDHVALQTGIAHQLNGAFQRIDDMELCVAHNGFSPGIPLIVNHGAVFDGVQLTVGTGCQSHQHGFGLHQQGDLTGLHVSDIQVGVVLAGAGQQVHGGGNVVIGHVVDIGEGLAHVDLLLHLVGGSIQDEELPVGLPVCGVITIGVDLTVHVLLGEDGVIEVIQGIVGAGVAGVQLDPGLGVHGSNVSQQVRVQVVSTVHDGDDEGDLVGLTADFVHHSGSDGGLTGSESLQVAILGDFHNGLVSHGQDQVLAGSVEGSHGDGGNLLVTGEDQHILSGDGFDSSVGQLRDLIGNHVHTGQLQHAGFGGVANVDDEGITVIQVDPHHGSGLAPVPQQHIVVVVPAHGLQQVQVAEGLFHEGHCSNDAAHAVLGVVLNEQLAQGAGNIDGVHIALGVDGESHQTGAGAHVHDAAVVHVNGIQGVLVGVVVQDQGVHHTGGVIVSHVHGVGADGGAQRSHIIGGVVIAVQLTAHVVAVEVAVMTVVVAGHEVNGGSAANQGVVHGLHIHVDHVAVVAVSAVVIVGLKVTLNVHADDGAACGQITVGNGDSGGAFAHSGDNAIIDGGDGLVSGGPDQLGLVQLIVPGQPGSSQLTGGAQGQDQLVSVQANGGSLGGFGELVIRVGQSQQTDQLGDGAVLNQVALVIEGLGQVGACVAGPVGSVDGDQLRGAAVVVELVVSPVQVAVQVGDGLAVGGGSQRLAVGVGEDDGVALSVSNGSHFIGAASHIQGKDAGRIVLGSVQGAVVIIGDGPGAVEIVTVGLDLGQLAGQQVHGVQVGVGILLGQNIHGIGGIVEGHIQDIDADVGNVLTVEQAGIHDDQVVDSVHSEDLAVNVFGSVDGGILHVVIGPDGDSCVILSGSGLAQLDPAVHVVGHDVLVIHTVCVQGVLVHLGQVLACDGVLDFVVTLVACVVTDSDHQFVAQAGDVEGRGQVTVFILSHLEISNTVVNLGAGGIHQEHGSDCNVVGDLHGHGCGGFLDDLFGNGDQSCAGVIDVEGDLDGFGNVSLVIQLCLDGQHDLGAVGQDIALGVGEVVHTFAVPGVQPGNDLTIVGVVHGLGVVGVNLLVHDLAVDGVGHGHGLCVTQQGDVHLIQAVDDAVTVGGDGVMGGIIDDVAVLVGNSAGVGVEAQDPVGASQGGPHDGVILITLGQTVGRRQAPEAVVVPESGIEGGGSGPVAIEAQEGQIQLHSALFVGQVNEAFHIAAVLPVLGEHGLVFLGQGDSDLHAGLAAGGHGDGVFVEGNGTGQSGVVACHEVDAVIGDSFSQQAAGQGVGLLNIGEVVDLKAEGVDAGSVVTQLSLGTAAGHGQVGLGGGSLISVHQTCALLTGRSLHAGHGADDGICGGHHQCLSQCADRAGGGIGVQGVQILHHQSGNTGHLRSGHGSTGHQAVLAVIIAGVDVAANTGDVGNQLQVGGNAPGGEGADLAAVGNTLSKLRGGSQGLVLGGIHGVAVGQGDQTHRDAGDHAVFGCGGHTEREDVVLIIVVPDDTGGSAGVLSVESLLGEAQFAAHNNGDLTLDDAVALCIIEVLGSAQTGNEDILQLHAVQSRHAGRGLTIQILDGIHIEDLGAVGQSEVAGHDLGVLCGSDGQGVDIGGGGADGCVVGVAGAVEVSAPHVAVGAGALVAGRVGGNDILGSQTLIDQVQFGVAGSETGGGAQRGVDNITAQGHGVFQSSHDVIGGSTHGVGTEDLHDDDLCVGSHADDGSTLNTVGGGNTGNVGTVVALLVSAVVSSQVVVGIVEGVGDLNGMIQVRSGNTVEAVGDVQIGQNGSDILDSHRGAGGLGISSERGVIQIQAGVDDGNLHAGTGVAQLGPNVAHAGHLIAGCGQGLVGALGIGGDGLVVRHHENALDIVQQSDLSQVLELSLNGNGVGQVGELITDLQFIVLIHDVFLDGGQNSVLLLQQLVLSGGGNIENVVVGFGQRLSFHNHEGDDLLVSFVVFSGSLQLFQAFGSLSGKEIGAEVFDLGHVPLASGFGGFHLGRDEGVILLGGDIGRRVGGRDNTAVIGGGLVGGDKTAGLAASRLCCVDGRGQGADQHAQDNQDCQQAIASHNLPPIIQFSTGN